MYYFNCRHFEHVLDLYYKTADSYSQCQERMQFYKDKYNLLYSCLAANYKNIYYEDCGMQQFCTKSCHNKDKLKCHEKDKVTCYDKDEVTCDSDEPSYRDQKVSHETKLISDDNKVNQAEQKTDHEKPNNGHLTSTIPKDSNGKLNPADNANDSASAATYFSPVLHIRGKISAGGQKNSGGMRIVQWFNQMSTDFSNENTKHSTIANVVSCSLQTDSNESYTCKPSAKPAELLQRCEKHQPHKSQLMQNDVNKDNFSHEDVNYSFCNEKPFAQKFSPANKAVQCYADDKTDRCHGDDKTDQCHVDDKADQCHANAQEYCSESEQIVDDYYCELDFEEVSEALSLATSTNSDDKGANDDSDFTEDYETPGIYLRTQSGTDILRFEQQESDKESP